MVYWTVQFMNMPRSNYLSLGIYPPSRSFFQTTARHKFPMKNPCDSCDLHYISFSPQGSSKSFKNLHKVEALFFVQIWPHRPFGKVERTKDSFPLEVQGSSYVTFIYSIYWEGIFTLADCRYPGRFTNCNQHIRGIFVYIR